MQEIIYSIKVPPAGPVRDELSALLATEAGQLPQRVRLSTLAPLSNRGYPPDAEAELLAVTEVGVVIGVANSKVPRTLVPWQNIAYVAEE